MVLKTTLQISTGLLNVLSVPLTNELHPLLQAFFMLRGSQNEIATGLLHAFRYLKWTLRTSTGLLQALQYSKPTLRNIYRHARSFDTCKTHSPNLYSPLTCIALVTMDSPNLYRSGASFAVLKTDSLNLYRPPTHFAVVKMDTLNIYCLLHDLRYSKPTLQACYQLCGTKNQLSKSLQASYLL